MSYALLLVFLFVGAQVSEIMATWYLQYWADKSPSEQQDRVHLAVYGSIVLILIGITLARSFLFMKGAIRASKTLHDRSLASILGSPISFIDSNPIGRMLNRFSKDLGLLDDMLPICMLDFLQGSLAVIGSVILASILNPIIFVVTVPLAGFFVWYFQPSITFLPKFFVY